MSVALVFTDTMSKLTSIKVKTGFIQNPKPANNRAKTPSNANDVFKYINIWDDQINEMIKGNNYAFNTDSAIFIEFTPGEAMQLLNKVTSYPQARMTFHIFSILLNSPDRDKMEQNIKIFEYRDTLISYIKGWSPSGCSSFMSVLDQYDYRHENITKCLVTFNFNFIDKTGSIFDPNSPNYYDIKKIVGLTLSSTTIFQGWVSGLEYTEYSGVVINGYESIEGHNAGKRPMVFLCKTTNSDILFIEDNWIRIYSWLSKKSYLVNQFVYLYNHVYECIVANEDEIFNPDNWEQTA